MALTFLVDSQYTIDSFFNDFQIPLPPPTATKLHSHDEKWYTVNGVGIFRGCFEQFLDENI